jgi:hemolysin activation/secretion protein
VVIDGGFTIQDARARETAVIVSHDQWRVADLSASYSGASFLGSLSASLDAAQGIGILGATSNGTLNNGQPLLSRSGNTSGNPEFTKVTLSSRYARELVAPVTLVISAQAQYAFAPLLAGEQIAFGGAQIGRGYDPSAITGDHGAGAAFELRYDMAINSYGLESLEPYVFFDTAKVWDVKGGAPTLSITALGIAGTGSGLALASTGLGMRFAFAHNITGGIEFARTLKGVPGSDGAQHSSKLLFDAAVRF